MSNIPLLMQYCNYAHTQIVCRYLQFNYFIKMYLFIENLFLFAVRNLSGFAKLPSCVGVYIVQVTCTSQLQKGLLSVDTWL